VSNIRPAGLSYDLAAFKLAWLIDQAFKRQLTGVALKDDSGTLLLDGDVVSRKAQAPPS
jgi:ethanolamine ammonia-lyase small subunit